MSTWFVEFEWFDGQPGSFHVSTDDLARTQRADEANVFLPRTWVRSTECPNILTCTHTADARSTRTQEVSK